MAAKQKVMIVKDKKAPWYLAVLRVVKGLVFMALASAALYASSDIPNWNIPEQYKGYAVAVLGSLFMGIYKYFTAAKEEVLPLEGDTDGNNQ